MCICLLRCIRPFGSLQWRHDERQGVSNHRRLDCLLNRLFRRISKNTSKLRVTSLCEGNPPDSPHKGPVTRKMFLFDNVIMHRFGNCVKHSACIIVSRPYPQTMTMDYDPFLFNLSWKSGIKREFQFKYENNVTRYLTQQSIKLRALFEIQSRMSVSVTRLIKRNKVYKRGMLSFSRFIKKTS